MSGRSSEKKKDNNPEISPSAEEGLKRGGIMPLIFTVILLFLSFSISSGAKEEQTKEEKKEEKPVVITSDKLMADNKKHTSLFEGNVIAKTEDMTIYSDRMMIYNTEDGKKIDRIDASGNVKVIKGERTIVSKEATFYDEEQKVIFTGDPQAWEGDNKVTGSMITYFIKDDRSIVENSKVVIINKKDKEKEKGSKK